MLSEPAAKNCPLRPARPKDTFKRTFRYSMSTRRPKSIQRAFPWRQSLLEALRRNPKIVLACEAANISRNTLYTHLRKDARFRRQWERALDRGFQQRYRAHAVRLAADPHVQRAMSRAAAALQWRRDHADGITDLHNLTSPSRGRACAERNDWIA